MARFVGISENKFPMFYAVFTTIRRNLKRKDIIEIAIIPIEAIIPPSDTQTRVENKVRKTTGEKR